MNENILRKKETLTTLTARLQTVPAGHTTTVSRLVREVFPDTPYAEHDLTGLAVMLFKAAPRAGLLLETGYHHGEPVGLPQDICFTVWHKKPGPFCPYCGSRDTAFIFYGYPADFETIEEDERRHLVSIGGCIVRDATKHCFCCGRDFGQQYDMRQIREITFLRTSGGTGPSEEVVLTREDAALFLENGDGVRKPLTARKWAVVIVTLFNHLSIQDWPEEMNNPCVLDGETREISVTMKDGTFLSRSGCNAHPAGWDAVLKLFLPLARMK